MLRVRASWWRGAPAGRALAGAISLGAVACGAAPTDGDFHGEEPIGEVRQGITVDQAVSGGCSTATVAGLNQQIIDGMNCLIAGGALKEVPARSNFKKGGTTLAWMQPAAVDALVAALDARPTTTFTANSMFRTVAAQYLLYRWYEAGRCGIQLAAPPGTSNHESGLAIDVQEYSTWRSTLEARGFVWLGSGDVVHYDYKGAGATNLKGKDVLAYQRLWNLNHPEDLLDEDGVYGPQTGARLAKSPVDGFAKPPTCGSGGAGGAGGGTGTGTGGAAGTGGGAGAPGSAGSAGAAGASGGGGAAGSWVGDGSLCTPGEAASCVCPRSETGYQLCAADGESYDDCHCLASSGTGGGGQATHTSADAGAGCSCAMPGRGRAHAAWLWALLPASVVVLRRWRVRVRSGRSRDC